MAKKEIKSIDLTAKATPIETEGGEVWMTIPVQLRINRVPYGPGKIKVPEHMVDTIAEMVDKKQRADLSVFTGNNYLVQRMVDRSLVVTKVEKL